MINLNNRIMYCFKFFSLLLLLQLIGCSAPKVSLREVDHEMPEDFQSFSSVDSSSVADVDWKSYFEDSLLIEIIDTALQKNQELNIYLEELTVSFNEVSEKSGEYLPFVNAQLGAGAEKPGRFTRDGAVEHSLEIEEGREFPEPLGDMMFGLQASWELDIWKKLRNAKDAAQFRYLASTQGRNLLVSQLISELANLYYELMALDNLLEIINNNIVIQEDAVRKVKIQKDNAKANQLVVNRFEAQLLNTKNLQYKIKQEIVEAENRIHFLSGKYGSEIKRNSSEFMSLELSTGNTGIPASLLNNRPDIKQAELNMLAANLDVSVARADFFPRLDIAAGVGFQAFDPSFLVKPESLVFNFLGELSAPLINKKALKARYNMATAFQVQAVLEYEQSVLNAYTDVLNQLNKLDNYSDSYDTKLNEVNLLIESVNYANSLFRYAKADYVEVLLTQEEVLDAKMELVEIKLLQLKSKSDIYRALGGGWK